jgi:hypothetical protein
LPGRADVGVRPYKIRYVSNFHSATLSTNLGRESAWGEDFMSRFTIVVMLLAAGLFFWGVSYVMTPNGGDAEFQKMLEATEHVKSFRGSYVGSGASAGNSAQIWEVDCNRSVVHKVSQTPQTNASPAQVQDDLLLVGLERYAHQSDGTWLKTGDKHVMYSGQWYCDNLAQGSLRDLLPDARSMLRNAMIGKAEQKTVSGVRCQDWQFAMKSMSSGVHGTLCIGVEDHLPYEMTTDGGAHYTYSGYNQPIQLEVPEIILEQASSTGTN